MKRYTIYILILLLLGVVGTSLYFLLQKADASVGYYADIYVEGSLYTSIDLSEVTEAYQITLTGATGFENVVEVSTGCIRMASADCPDKICVRQGAITNSKYPITCLPHRIVITLRKKAPARGVSTDAISGFAP